MCIYLWSKSLGALQCRHKLIHTVCDKFVLRCIAYAGIWCSDMDCRDCVYFGIVSFLTMAVSVKLIFKFNTIRPIREVPRRMKAHAQLLPQVELYNFKYRSIWMATQFRLIQTCISPLYTNYFSPWYYLSHTLHFLRSLMLTIHS